MKKDVLFKNLFDSTDQKLTYKTLDNIAKELKLSIKTVVSGSFFGCSYGCSYVLGFRKFLRFKPIASIAIDRKGTPDFWETQHVRIYFIRKRYVKLIAKFMELLNNRGITVDFDKYLKYDPEEQ